MKTKKHPVIYSIRARLYLCARPVLATAAAFVLAGCAPIEAMHPFAVCTVGIKTDKASDCLWLALGCILSALARELSLFSFFMYCVPTVLYLLCIILLKKRNYFVTWIRMALLCLCCLIGAVFSDAKAYEYVMFALATVGGCALIPILDGAVKSLFTLSKRSVLAGGELSCVATVVCASVISVPKLEILGVFLPAAVLLMLTGIVSVSMHRGYSVILCSICTLLFLLSEVDINICLACIICAALTDLLYPLNRFSALAGFIAGDIIITLCIRSDRLVFPLHTVLLGALPVLLLNKKRLEILRGIGGSIIINTASEKKLASRCVALTAERLRSHAAVFDSLSGIFNDSTGSGKRGKRKELLSGAASRICSSCDRYDYCWRMRYGDTYSDFKQLAQLITMAGSISPYDVSDDFKARCKDWIGVLLDMNNAATKESPPTDNGNLMMSKQCKSIADMLYVLANDTDQASYDHDAEKRISSALCAEGYITKDVVCAIKNGYLTSVKIAMLSCRSDKPCVKQIPRLLRQTLGISFTLDGRNCSLNKGDCFCSYLPTPHLKAVCHASCKIKDGQTVCGDSFSLLELPDSRYLAAISDGMGSGAEAANESENAVAMLETLCMGQMDIRTAYDTVNQLLQLRQKSPESYSTMDACVLDLKDGICSWGKIGAAPGYFMRSGRAEAIQGSSLPMGIVEKIEPSITDRTIKAGDLLVLISDGIYDALVDRYNDSIATLLEDMKDSSCKEISAEVVRQAIKKSGGSVRDDMTVIAIRITAA